MSHSQTKKITKFNSRQKERLEYINIPMGLAETAISRTKEIASRLMRNPRATIGDVLTSVYLQGISDCITVQSASDESLLTERGKVGHTPHPRKILK